MEEIASPNLTLLFDMGNTISHSYEPWPFYKAIRNHIGYVHVKDCAWGPSKGRSEDYRYPGEGDAQVKDILNDLVASQYAGIVAIEPHVSAIIHQGETEVSAQEILKSYLRYAKQLETMLNQAVQAQH